MVNYTEVPSYTEKNKPTVLYRGSKEKTDVLSPQPVLDTEKERFPDGTKSVVFASPYRQEALAYSVASRRDVGNFQLIPFWKGEEGGEIGWRLRLSCRSEDFQREDMTYLYEIDPEGFVQNSAGEWYATDSVTPIKRIEMTVREALTKIDVVEFAE